MMLLGFAGLGRAGYRKVKKAQTARDFARTVADLDPPVRLI
jgi:hypothetical protein